MMKRLGFATAVLALGLAAGCGDDNGTPGGPSGNLTVFTVQLLPSNENPPITNVEQSARGTAVITINSETNTVDFAVSLNSFPTTSTLTAAHIHGPAGAGVNANVIVNTGLSTGNAPSLSSGSGTFTFNGAVGTNATIVPAILANPQNYYFNVHTTVNPGGVIRGQLR
jgi:hypothetical protein